MATDWAKLLQDLLVKRNTGIQDILDQENNLRLTTQRGLFDRGKEKEAALTDVGVNAADRGMLNSGIALNDVAQTGNVYNTLMDRIKEDESNGLARLARSRLGIENAYSSGELDIQKGRADESAAEALAKQKADQEAALQQQATSPGVVPWQYRAPDDTRTQEQYDSDLANWFKQAAINEQAKPIATASAPKPRPKPKPKAATTPPRPQPLRPIKGAY